MLQLYLTHTNETSDVPVISVLVYFFFHSTEIFQFFGFGFLLWNETTFLIESNRLFGMKRLGLGALKLLGTK